MVYMPEQDVCRLISSEQLMSWVSDLLVQQKIFSGLNVEETLAEINLATKGGYIAGLGYGVRIRTGGEGHYTTVVWDSRGRFLGVLEASALTYLRTAALLLTLPFQAHMRVRRVLVMGTGKLGTACIELLCHLYPQAVIAIWSRSQDVWVSRWLAQIGVDGTQVQWWKPASRQTEEFDIVLTCTRAEEPLSELAHVYASYVGVGGAVNNRRRELPTHWLKAAQHICADDPVRAQQKCGDLIGLEGNVETLSDCLLHTALPARRVLCFICGIGAIDVGLALLLLKHYQETL